MRTSPNLETTAAPVSRLEAAAICAAAALAVSTLNLSPGLEPQLRAELGLAPAQVGLFFMVELGAMALASPAFAALLRRAPAPHVVRLALTLWIAGQSLSLPALQHFAALLGARALAGFGAGLLMLTALEAAGRSERPQRLLAALVATQIGGGALELALLPPLFALGGLSGVFVALALLGAAAFGIVAPLCRRLVGRGTPAPRATSQMRVAVRVFCMAWLFNVAIGALWTFLPELAPPSLAAAALPPLLAQATLFGLCGAAAAGALGRHGRPRRWRVAGMLLLAASALALHAAREATPFALCCFATSFAWSFSVPFVLSHGTPGEAGASAMPAVNAAFATGLAAGPPIGGALLEASGAAGLITGITALLALAAALAAASRR